MGRAGHSEAHRYRQRRPPHEAPGGRTYCQHHEMSTKERGEVQLQEEDPMDSSCKNKAKGVSCKFEYRYLRRSKVGEVIKTGWG